MVEIKEKNKDSVMGNILLLTTPALSLGLFIVLQLVSFGLQSLTTDFWYSTLINMACLLLAFVPLYQWARNRRRKSQKIQNQIEEFNRTLSGILEGNKFARLREYAEVDLTRRKAEYIRTELHMADLEVKKYEDIYQTWTNAEIAESGMKDYQKRTLRRLNRNLRFKKVNIDKLYSEKVSGVRDRFGTTSGQQQVKDIAGKVVNGFVMALLMASIAFQPLEGVNPVVILANCIVKAFVLAYNSGMAILAGNKNIDVVYSGELNQKIFFLKEFLEYDSKHPGWENRTELQNGTAMVE